MRCLGGELSVADQVEPDDPGHGGAEAVRVVPAIGVPRGLVPEGADEGMESVALDGRNALDAELAVTSQRLRGRSCETPHEIDREQPLTE